ncbi:indole-3-glycerol phosphate synthase TrpC [Myxococcus xanthus]|uniref:Indole-3-glycerol phosphate synthase n=1 Tax=Myxococcus xanthus TaxID=34 RepID=A0AAE6G519_MYXXA|nr:indole-3-glycerol phosphate synthase TrpC [Myxococcus xanthus]QDE70932.1 indole-3-glycerol phosphate synthase [Myxococcus xanthus]QDE78211.1 indole-3-glycerol phosphate synthase [Myxococcus xanthus]QDE85597.1 indole-3-glycerol phosphate synthase [Myxococcus xanthus]QDE99755.1 indole-3-glycerol phosphate synthase [Myxococcus xanthus]QDF07487.1 indole-3-glycerol phosphate synthase [Myxococcus xanthus]
MSTTGTLDRIMARKRQELAARPPMAPRTRPTPRDFAQGLVTHRSGRRLSVIAEVKRKSPSGGDFPHADVVAVARAYEAAGASAISVLTDGPDFGGGLEDLVAVRAAVSLPVLRKDFLVAAREVEESAMWGADAVLLIADALEDGELREMVATAKAVGVAALVEAHTEAHAERALAAGAKLVGINNRDLATLKTDTGTALRVMPKLRTRARVLVAESGLKSLADLMAAQEAGADAVLVGESLLREPDPGHALRRLLGVKDAAP